MRKLLLSVVALFAMSAQNAFAINLTFQFDVNSSGPSIYACNAGIKHGPSEKNICFDRTNPAQSCSAGCAAGNMNACYAGIDYVEPKNCVCTGEYDPTGTQGTYRMDYLQAITTDWTDNQSPISGEEAHSLIADLYATVAKKDEQKFNQLFGSDTYTNGDFTVPAAYKKQIKEMTVNLGSELYGAEYFVDICYRGPQIDYKPSNGKPGSGTNKVLGFNLLGNTTIFDIKKAGTSASDSYDQLAGLEVKAEARCIVNDYFNYCLADLIPGETSGCNTGGTVPTAHGYTVASSFQKLTTSNVNKLLKEASINHNDNKTPRFCQIRYSFRETNTSAIRKWKLQQARICTYTEISEPSSSKK